MISPVYRKTIIPNVASRNIFFRVRSCERVGLRREESLFGVSLCSYSNSSPAVPFCSLLCALCVRPDLCVIVFPGFSATTLYSLPTTHWSPA
jgi:hypothetical protein